MWQTWLLTIVGALLPLLVVLLWKINRALNRMWDVLQEYPPHRHVKKDILYPRGMSPEQAQELEEHTVARV